MPLVINYMLCSFRLNFKKSIRVFYGHATPIRSKIPMNQIPMKGSYESIHKNGLFREMLEILFLNSPRKYTNVWIKKQFF